EPVCRPQPTPLRVHNHLLVRAHRARRPRRQRQSTGAPTALARVARLRDTRLGTRLSARAITYALTVMALTMATGCGGSHNALHPAAAVRDMRAAMGTQTRII